MSFFLTSPTSLTQANYQDLLAALEHILQFVVLPL